MLPALWEQQTFIDKAGPEIVNQMWAFPDRGGRPVCLIPEATGPVQQLWRDSWSRTWPKPSRIFYVQRCYRYERPQRGRYREFTQLGVELLGGTAPDAAVETKQLLLELLDALGLRGFTFSDSVRRGLSYYVEDGFEVEVATLGAQKQVAGGGRYAEGIGWAIGVDRLMLALEPSST